MSMEHYNQPRVTMATPSTTCPRTIVMKRYAVVQYSYSVLKYVSVYPAVLRGDTEVLQLCLHGGFCHRGDSQTNCFWPAPLFQREVFRLSHEYKDTHKHAAFILRKTEIACMCVCVPRWNQLDLAIVLLSIMGITLEEIDLNASLPINPTIIRIMRVLRITRGTHTATHEHKNTQMICG